MKKLFFRLLCLLLCAVLALSAAVPAAASVTQARLEEIMYDAAEYVYTSVKSPEVASIGGEWAVLGLARSPYSVPDSYYLGYCERLEKTLRECGGVLHDRKYTEYSRVIVALSAIGRDARDVAGYDLTKPLGDYDKTVWQGLNGPIWALIALDSRDYPMPQNPEAKTQATRQMYIDRILSCRNSDGGWSLFGGTSAAGDEKSDPDVTGMALQALAKYQNQPEVGKAIDEALACMSEMQNSDGGFDSWGSSNSESSVQMLVALTELGIDIDDPRFVKNGSGILDSMLSYYVKGGGFLHTADGKGVSQMSAEQGLYGVVAAWRAMTGKSSLYRMDDAIAVKDAAAADKKPAVKAPPVTKPDAAFTDVSGAKPHPNREAIEALASRGIINGRGGGLFDPDSGVTRAEYAAIVIRALGVEPKAAARFSDVPQNAWYAAPVGAAAELGIVAGRSAQTFDPDGAITRQEAAVMTSRAAKLCGMDTDMPASAVRDVLAQFEDYVKSAQWARESLAFCYEQGLLDDSALEIYPSRPIKRCETAQLVYNLLLCAQLL